MARVFSGASPEQLPQLALGVGACVPATVWYSTTSARPLATTPTHAERNAAACLIRAEKTLTSSEIRSTSISTSVFSISEKRNAQAARASIQAQLDLWRAKKARARSAAQTTEARTTATSANIIAPPSATSANRERRRSRHESAEGA